MKKRLISLALVLAMVTSMLALFTGCGSTGNVVEESTTPPMTITIAMITEKETTPEGIQVVQDALNKITEKTLNTHVALQFYTAEEYDAAIQAKIKARLEYRANNETDLNSVGKDEDKTLNEYGREVTVYPEPFENQIDIFLVNGASNLDYYAQFPSFGVSEKDYEDDPASNSESVVATLDSYLTDGTATLLTKYISTALIDKCKVNGELKAIPSNAIVGNAEYLLINKELFDKYSYSIDSVTDITSLQYFLTDVAQNEPDVTPLYNYGSMGLVSVNGQPSALAAVIANENVDPATTSCPPLPITSNLQLKDALAVINSYASIAGKYPVSGWDLSEAETGTFAAGFISANSIDLEAYEEDYYMVQTRASAVSNDQLYNNAFAVFEYSSDPARCAKIINLIQTDREFHNLLLYGVENVTYTVNEDTGLVERKPEGTDGAVYMMDINRCGNLFISMPNSEMSETELALASNDWEKAKAMTRSLFLSPYLGFDVELGDDAEHKQPTQADFDTLEKLFYETFDKISEYPNVIDETTGEQPAFEDYLETVDEWLLEAENSVVTNQNNTASSSLSIKRQYADWWTVKFPPAT